MLSNFNPSRRRSSIGTKATVDETYDLRGLNLLFPNQTMQNNETPFLENTRMYAPDEGESSVAMRTRKGSERMSIPVGETKDAENTDTGIGDLIFDVNNWIVMPFEAESDGRFTKLTLDLKRATAGSGHVIVEVYSDASNTPGEKLAQGSMLNSIIASTYSELPAYFIDAPALVDGGKYWLLVKAQEGATATFALHQTATGDAMSTIDSGASYSTLNAGFRYATYVSTGGDILGFTRQYNSNGENRTYFAMGTELISVEDSGVSTSIHSGIDVDSQFVRFEDVDDNLIFIDGHQPAKWRKADGTVENISGVMGTPTHVWFHKNRLFFVEPDNPTRVYFSELYKFNEYPSVNFFYVDRPKSSDHISGGIVFQDNLTIFTHESKFTVFGSDIASFTMKQALGTKGAVNQEAITTDSNFIYFMADDKQIYRWAGGKDVLLSAKVSRELNRIQDPKKVRLHVYNNQLRVYYNRSPNNNVQHMLLLELDETTPNKYLQWFHDTGRPVMGSLEWTQDENQLIEFSSLVGGLYYGERTDADLGKAINFKYWTAFKIYGSGQARDRIRKFRPMVRPVSQPFYMKVGKAIDFNEGAIEMQDWLVDSGGAKWGSFVFGDGTKFSKGSEISDQRAPMSGRGKATQFRIECDLVATPVLLYGYFALVKIGKVK